MAADVTGKWNVTATTNSGREYKFSLELKSDGGKLAGAMTSPDGTYPVQDVQLAGDQLTYKVAVNDGSYNLKFTVAGDSMKGTWTAADGNTGNIVAARAGGAIAGRWKAVSKSDSGRQREVFIQIGVRDGRAIGTLDSPEGSVDLTEVKVEGDALSFKIPTDDVTYTVKMTLSDGVLKGNYSATNGESGSVTATR
jgi:hypothetical protein